MDSDSNVTRAIVFFVVAIAIFVSSFAIISEPSKTIVEVQKSNSCVQYSHEIDVLNKIFLSENKSIAEGIRSQSPANILKAQSLAIHAYEKEIPIIVLSKTKCEA